MNSSSLTFSVSAAVSASPRLCARIAFHSGIPRRTILPMQIRPVTPGDLDAIREIDGTVESTQYLHLEQAGQGLAMSWRLEPRTLREKLIQSNPLSDEADFALRQIAGGM